jgi:hypothetical protein
MKKIKISWFVLVFIVSTESVAQMSASDAFSQGNQSASVEQREQIMSSISGDTAVEVIKGFDPSKRPEGGGRSSVATSLQP